MTSAGEARQLQLEWLPGRYAVCRLNVDAPVPPWAMRALQRAGASFPPDAADEKNQPGIEGGRLIGNANAPARDAALVCLTRTDRELSIVCDETIVPSSVRAERGFAALRVVGTLDFNLTGIIARITVPLAQAGVPVFVISTFDTDYVLVRAADHDRADDALSPFGPIVKQ